MYPNSNDIQATIRKQSEAALEWSRSAAKMQEDGLKQMVDQAQKAQSQALETSQKMADQFRENAESAMKLGMDNAKTMTEAVMDAQKKALDAVLPPAAES